MALRSIIGYGVVEENLSDGEELDIVDEDEPVVKKSQLSILKESVVVRNSPSPGSQIGVSVLRPTASLVSYHSDEGSEDENSGEGESPLRNDEEQFVEHIGESPASALSVDGSETPEQISTAAQENTLTTRGGRLPPEPEGRCSRSLQEKIERMLGKKRMGKLSLNSHVQKKKDFRNPSIYEKLVSFVGIKETGTNYPKKLFDPDCWDESSFYDELAKAQKDYHAKKEKEKHKRAQVEFVTGTKKPPGQTTTSSDDKPRKTKFDMKPHDVKSDPASKLDDGSKTGTAPPKKPKLVQ